MSSRKQRQKRRSVLSDIVDKALPGKCRVCLQDGNIPIYGKKDISRHVMECAGIYMSDDDNLPQNLCKECESLLKAAILLRKKAQKSDEFLRQGDYSDDAATTSEHRKANTYQPDTDDESFIKREYLEYDNSSELEFNWVDNVDTDELYDTKNFVNLERNTTVDENEFKMEVLDEEASVKQENDEVDNEMVMIIVSDKDKPLKTVFSCIKCDIKFETASELEKHKKENHAKILAHQTKCEICHKIVDKSDYKEHVKAHREKYKMRHEKRYPKVDCEVCGKKINKSYLKYHMKKHGDANDQAERFKECPVCHKSLSVNYYNDHMRRKHEKHKTNKDKEPEVPEPQIQTYLKCPICDKMIDKKIYKDHLAKHGGSTRRYICDKCGRVFKHPSAFKTHTLTHGSELKYKCQFCSYRGLHLGLLKIHVRTHTGDYNYKCTECSARFITKSNLTKHMHRHAGSYKFKCDTCGKGFYNKRDIDRHIRTVHLALKNYTCDICDKGFGHRDNLLGHQRRVHKREKIMDRVGRMPSYLKQAATEEE
ncbi:uncharacterized protein LOC142983682 [Anticarsia gemmatalis]|uniref:uncharacterized protein LOC142983682 n=1 Tax=Anticarsia gemmatalis TaxID=129554 RepID=UPI003F75E534